MPRPFLGTGLGFPPSVDSNGALTTAPFEESVRQAIWVVLTTARGERRMRPDFGCGIHDLVFAPNTPATAGRVAREVREALLRFEPRAEVLDVSVSAGADAAMLIDIGYRVRATNNVFNMVYPFYTDGGGLA